MNESSNLDRYTKQNELKVKNLKLAIIQRRVKRKKNRKHVEIDVEANYEDHDFFLVKKKVRPESFKFF